MSNDFSIEPPAVRSASQVFVEQQPVPAQLSTSVSGARGVDTGDPGVNTQLGGVVDELSRLLTRYSEVLGLYSEGLYQMADRYESGDSDVADSFDQIQTPGQGSWPSQTTPARPPLTSSLGIVAKLS